MSEKRETNSTPNRERQKESKKIEKSIDRINKKLEEIDTHINNKKESYIWRFLEIFGFLLGILAIWLSFYLSNSIELEVWHNISEKDGTLEIYGKNNDLFRSTGIINIYQLEMSDSKPQVQLIGNNTLEPREERLLSTLLINIGEENIRIPFNENGEPFVSGKSYPVNGSKSKLFSINENTSISYKITCESCSEQGIIRRIPPFQKVQLTLFTKDQNRIIAGKIPTYSWIEYHWEDVKI